MTETPIIDILCAIEEYNSSHNAASTAYKSALWNLSKARRQKGALGSGYSYCASDVREELRAFATLEDNEHDLVDEECTKGTGDVSRTSCSFVLSYADNAKKMKITGICFKCNISKKKTELKDCSKCMFARYCSKVST